MTHHDWRHKLRNQMLARRLALSPTAHAELSARLVGHLLSLPLSGLTVAFCWPIKNEPDVRPAILHWRENGGQAALPVVVSATLPLAFRAWTPTTPLFPDRFGVPTPQEGAFLVPDVILLPLNAFDSAGYRLGYGGGYFDRTLAAFSPRPLAIGVGFEINRVTTIRPEPHDQRLDWIVTESGTFPIADPVQEA